MLTFAGVIRAYAHNVFVLCGDDNGTLQWESLLGGELSCASVEHVFCHSKCLVRSHSTCHHYYSEHYICKQDYIDTNPTRYYIYVSNMNSLSIKM